MSGLFPKPGEYNGPMIRAKPNDARILNHEQEQAVKHGDGPLLIIAGAGTGKTTVVTERIKYLISSGRAKPDEILALTFTEKASHEMEERVETALPYGLPQMYISTFHSFCDRILRAESLNIGFDPGFKLMSEAETVQFFRKHLFEFSLTYFRPLGNPNKFISGLIAHFSRLKDEDVTPGDYEKWVKNRFGSAKPKTKSRSRKTPAGGTGISQYGSGDSSDLDEAIKFSELSGAYRLYESLKIRDGVADYSDLISNTLRIFRTRTAVLEKYRKQFKYVLVDEFQDTNYAQNELAIILSGKAGNLTAVGDDDQAIYRWRGAAVSNIIHFRSRFPGVKIIVLTKNYRSTKSILDRSYELIKNNNPDRLEVMTGIDKKLESMRRISGSDVEMIFADRVENEADAVATKIKSIKENTQKIDDVAYQWSDFAVLVRANNHAEPFIRALVRKGMPYQFLGPGQLFRQPEVKDLIAYLKILYDFSDSIAVYRVLCMDWLKIVPRDISLLLSHAKKFGISLFEACETASGVSKKDNDGVVSNPVISASGKDGIRNFVQTVYKHMDLIKKESAGQILYYFLVETGMLQELTNYSSVREERVAVNIARFFDKLKSYESDHDDASVYAVVDWIELSMALGESPLASDSDWTANNAVNILTVHSAKGLEFPVVFMVNLVSARFPTTEKHEQIPIPDELVKEELPAGDFHVQEERRLFYVGMTRARDRLIFTAAKYYGEGKREKNVSQFIPETLPDMDLASITEVKKETKIQLNLLDWNKTQPEPEISRQEKIRVTYISYSQLDTYKTCPLQYKYRYIMKIPVPPSAALTFGDTIHRTLKSFYDLVKLDKSPDLDTLQDLYRRSWNPAGYGNIRYAEKMKLHGMELLSEYFKRGYLPGYKPQELEYPFKIRIAPDLVVGGKIDRVDRLDDNSIEIIDYKTGQAPRSKNPRNDLQLTVYVLAATDPGIFNLPEDRVTVSFYFLENQQKVSAKRTVAQLDEAKNIIRETVSGISENTFRPTPGKHCDFCEFRLICEAWK